MIPAADACSHFSKTQTNLTTVTSDPPSSSSSSSSSSSAITTRIATMNVPVMDDSIERAELSAGGEVSPSETDRIQEPNEGMTFDSEAAARAFYVEYAGRAGFITRVLSSRKSERDGSIISRGLGCRGIPDTQKIGNAATVKRDRRREGCAAMILMKREKPGTWVVRKFVKDHNHPLMVSLPKRHSTFDEKDKKIQELTAELRVKKRLSAAYREHLLGIMKDVESHSEHLSSKVQSIRDNLRSLDAKRQELLTRERPSS